MNEVKNKSSCVKKILLGVAIVFSILVAVFNIVALMVFPINSVIDTNVGEINSHLQSTNSVVDSVIESIENFTYSIETSDGEIIEVQLREISSNIDEEKILSKLNEISKIANWYKRDTMSIDISDCVSFDREKVLNIIKDINEKNKENIVEPQDAYIYYNVENREFDIEPERYSNILLEDNVSNLIDGFTSFNSNINLVELGCYSVPNITKDSVVLLENLSVYNKYKDFNLVYTFNGNNEIIDISVLNSWLIPNYNEDKSLNKETPFSVSDELLNEYIGSLNKKYTTIGIPRSFVNSLGETITISGGDYGWILDRKGMNTDIKSHILSCLSETKEGLFTQKGSTFGERDFTNSYVEVSIANQRVWMYVNGECIVDTPVVTGNVGRNMGTRKGVFSLTYKTKNAVLRGADYETPVKYWMPFDGGIGLHDATWRGSFGGNIYKWNGSHGCVNMPLNAAKTVYENIDKSMPIIVW